MTDEGTPLDWDDEIENDGQGFTIFPSGSVVAFEVMSFERTRSKNSGCPMAKLILQLKHEGSTGAAYENLVLNTKSEWRLCQFFIAIGQREHGQKLKPDWDALEGSKGLAKLKIEPWEGRDGDTKESNRVDAYIDPADEVTPHLTDPGPAQTDSGGVGGSGSLPSEVDDENMPF